MISPNTEITSNAEITLSIRQVTDQYLVFLAFAVTTTALLIFGASELQGQEETKWGNLSGKIIVEGVVPAATPLTLTTDDRQFCIDTGQEFVDESLIVSSEGGLKNAYVMMYFARNDPRRPEVHPSYDEKQPTVVLDNVNCRFEPQALFLRTGQPIEFRNSDRIGHNCHVATMGNEENCSLGAGQSLDMDFEEADKIPGKVYCDAHPWMQATLLIRDEPYVAITDAEGNFHIENIPAGEWKFQFWHKRSGYLRTLTREGKEFVGRRGEFTVTIAAGETLDLGELKISADDLQE